jgi:hypothetical protein
VRFELRGLAPDVEKHVAQEVFGQGLVAYEAQQPAVQRNPMAHKKGLQGELIAGCDPPDQHFVRGNFPCRGILRPRGGRSRPDKGDSHGYPL